jgi:hypothetical protein
MKTTLLLIGVFAILLVVYLFVFCPGRMDISYCGMCGKTREDKFAGGVILINRIYKEVSWVSDWHDSEREHVWLDGSSCPYNGGHYDNMDGQYIFWFLHKSVDGLDVVHKPKMKNDVIAMMKMYKGGKESYLKTIELKLKIEKLSISK